MRNVREKGGQSVVRDERKEGRGEERGEEIGEKRGEREHFSTEK